MQKKTIQQPEIKVVKLQSKDVICTSGGINPNEVRGRLNESYNLGDASTWYPEQQK